MSVTVKRFLSLLIFVFLLAGSVFALFTFYSPTVETSLFSLIGEEQMNVPASIRDRSSGQIQVICSGKTIAEASSLAEKFSRQIPTQRFSQIRLKTDDGQLSEVLDFYRKNSSGILSAEDQKLLEQNKAATFTQRTIRSLFTSPIPQLIPFAEDPFGLMNHFIHQLPLSFSGWHTENGYLVAEEGENHYVLMILTLSQNVLDDLDLLSETVSDLLGSQREVDTSESKIYLCGVPMHTADVAGRCKIEIQILSIFSLLFIFGLAIFIFHSFRFLPWILLSLSASCLGGFLALGLAFPTIHLLSCVFATTLLGLTVDYSFHWLLTATPEHIPLIRKNLFSSWLTTEICFLPFAFSGISILQQTALFMAVGLTVALLCVLFFYPRMGEAASSWKKTVRGGAWGLLILFPIIFVGLFFLHFHTDVSALYRPSEKLFANEKLFRKLSGADDASRGLLVVHGDTLDQALEREEKINLPQSLPRLSRFLPSLSSRTENFSKVQSLYQNQTNLLAKKLQLKTPFKPLLLPTAWDPEQLPSMMVSPFLISDATGFYTLIPNVKPAEQWPEGVTFYAPKQILNRVMNHYSDVCLRLLTISAVILLIVLLFLFRRKAWLIALPSLIGILAVFSFLSLCGQTITLFHLLACFMVIGMSLDYTIFLASDFRTAQKPVLCSVLTSLAGFGALAFVSFPLVQFMGQALGIGLLLSFLVAYAIFSPKEEGTEQGASRFGLDCAWWVYRIFGKRVVDGLTRLIASCIWLTNPQVRRITGYRRLLNFALSLTDKLVVAANGKEQPKIVFEDTPDAKQFYQDVAERKGAFVISSHLGNIEVLAGLGNCKATFHAFMKVEQTAVFYSFLKDHACRPEVKIHPVSGFGMKELFLLGDIVDAGDCILMAGDRGEGRMRSHAFLEGERKFPVGTFHLAKVLEHSIYFVACVCERRGLYRVVVHALPRGPEMFEKYVTELEQLVRAYPDQWYQWQGEKSDE